ncbi:hypothetical protein PTSG_08975 [Salpingoeca rosetta]|uniref:Smr domain-containing protein n=1 Tax=Salpingoeca rosetta (strain ATCC 50818 / BSB-021) TaxID=946362 RepID=F2ULU7_SALR5|nr:uncharacterized protein PTSG_08975 [Salpingoeca rosetta]EGD78096.1 hypothetical protein PTSG_08975 [Salpingoeca rosetta]|eukprot:XP_004989772.1 hypothetical protein PTSG_08975 [Salpingoeca rosetta]
MVVRASSGRSGVCVACSLLRGAGRVLRTRSIHHQPSAAAAAAARVASTTSRMQGRSTKSSALMSIRVAVQPSHSRLQQLRWSSVVAASSSSSSSQGGKPSKKKRRRRKSQNTPKQDQSCTSQTQQQPQQLPQQRSGPQQVQPQQTTAPSTRPAPTSAAPAAPRNASGPQHARKGWYDRLMTALLKPIFTQTVVSCQSCGNPISSARNCSFLRVYPYGTHSQSLTLLAAPIDEVSSLIRRDQSHTFPHHCRCSHCFNFVGRVDTIPALAAEDTKASIMFPGIRLLLQPSRVRLSITSWVTGRTHDLRCSRWDALTPSEVFMTGLPLVEAPPEDSTRGFGPAQAHGFSLVRTRGGLYRWQVSKQGGGDDGSGTMPAGNASAQHAAKAATSNTDTPATTADAKSSGQQGEGDIEAEELRELVQKKYGGKDSTPGLFTKVHDVSRGGGGGKQQLVSATATATKDSEDELDEEEDEAEVEEDEDDSELEKDLRAFEQQQQQQHGDISKQTPTRQQHQQQRGGGDGFATAATNAAHRQQRRGQQEGRGNPQGDSSHSNANGSHRNTHGNSTNRTSSGSNDRDSHTRNLRAGDRDYRMTGVGFAVKRAVQRLKMTAIEAIVNIASRFPDGSLPRALLYHEAFVRPHWHPLGVKYSADFFRQITATPDAPLSDQVVPLILAAANARWPVTREVDAPSVIIDALNYIFKDKAKAPSTARARVQLQRHLPQLLDAILHGAHGRRGMDVAEAFASHGFEIDEASLTCIGLLAAGMEEEGVNPLLELTGLSLFDVSHCNLRPQYPALQRAIASSKHLTRDVVQAKGLRWSLSLMLDNNASDRALTLMRTVEATGLDVRSGNEVLLVKLLATSSMATAQDIVQALEVCKAAGVALQPATLNLLSRSAPVKDRELHTSATTSTHAGGGGGDGGIGGGIGLEEREGGNSVNESTGGQSGRGDGTRSSAVAAAAAGNGSGGGVDEVDVDDDDDDDDSVMRMGPAVTALKEYLLWADSRGLISLSNPAIARHAIRFFVDDPVMCERLANRALAGSTPNRFQLRATYGSLLATYMAARDYERCAHVIERMLERQRETGIPLVSSAIIKRMVRVYIKLGRLKEAIDLLTSSEMRTRVEMTMGALHYSYSAVLNYLCEQGTPGHEALGMELLHRAIAEGVFESNLRNEQQFELDLHELSLGMAQLMVLHFLKQAAAASQRRVTIITGKGLNSPNNVPVLRPMVERMLEERGIEYYKNPRNTGKLVVFLQPRKQRRKEKNKLSPIDRMMSVVGNSDGSRGNTGSRR